MIDLEVSNEDSAEFARRVGVLINGALHACGATSAFVIKTDNWFGKKWLGFSYKEMGAYGVHSGGDPETVPPFKPSRVISERYHLLDERSHWVAAEPPARVHVDQTGPANKWRRVHELFPTTALFWWSGRSGSNGRGALMAFLPADGQHAAWYTGCSAERAWRENERVCITNSELERLAAH